MIFLFLKNRLRCSSEMMARFFRAHMFTLFFCGTTSIATAAPAITVFTIDAFPATGLTQVPARVLRVDAVQRLNQSFAMGMPHEAIAAKTFVLDRINSPVGTDYFKQLKPAIEDLVTAWAWGVKALPAVVIESDGKRYVVYGTADSAVAMTVWERQSGGAR